MSFALFIVTFVGLMFAALTLPALLMLFVPGRKGFITVRRDVVHPGIGLEQAWELYRARLEFEKFNVDIQGVPHALRAARPKLYNEMAPGVIVTHAAKPVSIRVDLRPERDGTAASFALRLDDFVFYDTGEHRMLELTLHRLLSAELQSDPPPLVPTPSYSAIVGCAAAAMSFAGPWLARNWSTFSSTTPRTRAALVAFGALALAAIYMAVEALRNHREKPEEVSGTGIARAAIAGGVLGIIVNLAMLLRTF